MKQSKIVEGTVRSSAGPDEPAVRSDTLATDKSPADYIKKGSTIGVNEIDTLSQQLIEEEDAHSGTELGEPAGGGIRYQSQESAIPVERSSADKV